MVSGFEFDEMDMISSMHVHEDQMKKTYKPAELIKDLKLIIPKNIIEIFNQELEKNNLFIDNDETKMEIIAGLIKGNIIIQGPPGTGKTAIAKVICNTFNTLPVIETAIDDWTTYDTIGGFFPDVKDGQQYITGHNGKIVQSVVKCCDTILRRERSRLTEKEKENMQQATWLILDELNRAEIDKVFGEMFTVLGSGDFFENRKLELAFQSINKKELYIPNRYRIIGLMNNSDKNYVYDLSQALSRRFSFITLMPPKVENMPKELEVIKNSLSLRIKSKIDSIGNKKLKDELFEEIINDPVFVDIEKILIDILLHVRYSFAMKDESNTNGYLGANIGTALIKDIYETIVIRLILMDYIEKDTEDKKEIAEAVVDGAIASNLISQIDSQEWDKKKEFVEFFKNNEEWKKFKITIDELNNMSL